MTAKENALRIIRFDHPEWVMQAPPTYVLCYQGCNHEGYEGGGHDCPVGTSWTDIWGTGWRKEMDGVMGFPRVNPLANPSALKTYHRPDPDDPRIYERIYRTAQEPAGDVFLAGSHRDTLWEKSYMLVGMENMMAAFYTEPNFAREVLHRIMDFQIGIAKHYLDLGVEIVFLTDDLGSQSGPLLNPAIVREFFVPEYKRLFALYRERGVIINFHSCGNIEAFLDMFIELGVDILNPIQATANDVQAVRTGAAGQIALQGGVSTSLVMNGPVETITAEVRKRLWQLGRDGGYFCSPDQGMPFPPTHKEAFEQALETYGRYPIEEPN